MVRFREKQAPITQEEFNEMLKEHEKFIDSGGAGGKWKTWVVKGVVFGQYLGSEGLDGKQITLSYNNLEKIKLENISLTYADLVGVFCRGLNFKKINLTGSLCVDSDFTGSNFDGANLTRCDFSRSKMQGCNLKNANLTDTDLEDVDLTGTDLTGAIVTSGTSLKGTVFKNAVKDYKKVEKTSKKITKKIKTKTSSISYKNCSICKDIPNSCGAFWKGGDVQSNSIPDSEAKLEIVGAPFYDASTSYSHTIIKRCPECGTCYRWRFEYEYLVGGSEDDLEITRLSKEEGEKEAQRVILDVRMKYAQLRAEGVAGIDLMSKKLSNAELANAVDLFYHNQLCKGFDISYGVTHLVNALINHDHVKTDCAGEKIYWTLLEYANKSEKNCQKILELLLHNTLKTYKPEVKDLIKECKLKHLDKLTKRLKALEEKLKSKELNMDDYKRLNQEIEQLYKKIQDFS